MWEIAVRPHRHNQDRVGAVGRVAWVIDGASRADEAENEIVRAYVDRLDAAIRGRVARQTPEGVQALAALLDDAIREANQAGAQGDYPTATVGIATQHEDVLEVALVGDVWARSQVATDQRVVQDNRLQLVAPQLRQRFLTHRTPELHRELLEAEGLARNKVFFVAGRTFPGRHVIQTAILNDVSAGVLGTDGAYIASLPISPVKSAIQWLDIAAALADTPDDQAVALWVP